jgi:hypothetical protein
MDKLKAWVHWVKLNPLDDDQLQHALATERLLKENERLREALEFYADWDHGAYENRALKALLLSKQKEVG